MEIYATDPNSTTMSTSHDDWLLNFDSVERNRHRKAAAKRAKSFSLACKPESRSHAEYNQCRQPEAGSRVSSRLYSKAGDHNPTAMPHNRQSYADGMEHRYIQRRPHNIYSEDHSGLLLHGVTSYQPVSVAGQTADGRFPLKSSCSNLSDQYSQDSAYHSRHGSSIDATDPNSVGSDAWLGSGRGQARARFPSCPNANPQSFTTHTEEIVSPRTTRRIFEEAAMRNLSPMRDRTYNKMTLRSSESCQSVNRQNNEVGRSSGSMGSQRFDPVTGQLQRTKSFSAVWSEPNNLSSMTHVKQYDRRREWPDVRDGGCVKGNASPIRSRLFYNTMTQTEPEELLGGDAAMPFANRQWFDTGNLGRGNCDLDASGPNTSPKKFLNVEFSSSSLSNDRSDVETMPKKFTSDQATLVFTGSQESGYGRPADVSYSGSSDQDPGRAYSSNQASMMRRLSKELYGQKLGAGLSSRKSFSGDRHARLGSIDENSQSFETPGRNLGTRRKSSSEVEKHSEHSSRDVGCQPVPNDPEKTGDGDDDDDDLDLGDGCNFVRNRKPQMSLRKAFGIYDEFEISDDALRNHVPSPKQSLAQFGNRSDHPNSKPLHDASMQQKGFESCQIDDGFVKSLPQFEAGRQGDSFTQSQSRFFDGFQPRSNVPEVTRIKSASMPRQQTFTLMSPTGGSASYTGTGVPSTRHSMSSQDDLQYQRTAGEQEPRLSEVRRSVAGSGYSGGFGGQNLFPAGSSGVYDNNHSPRSVPVAARDDFAEDVPDTDSSSHSSTPPPMLPPRRYRKGSAGDVWTGSLGDELAPNCTEPYSGASADFDAESTIKRESYAHQLRQRSHRLSHSAVGSSYLHRRPPPPLTSVNTDESNDQSEGQWSSVARSSCVSGNQSLPAAFQCFEKSPLQKDFGENYGSGRVATSSWCHMPEQSCETPRTFQSTASVNVSGTFNEVSTNCASPVESGDNFSILPSSRNDVHRNSGSSEAIAESLDRYGLSGNVGATDDAYSPQTWTSRIDLETTGAARSISDDPEAEVAKTEHYRRSGERKKKADMAVVQPSVRLAEFTTEKFALSSSGCDSIKGPSPSKIGKVRGYPRPPGKSPDESAYDCAAAVAPQKLPYEEKSSFEFSAYETPASVVAARMPEEEIALSGSVSIDARQSQSVRVQVPDASFPEDDGPSSERVSGERPRSLIIPEEQRRPTGTILPSPQQQQQQQLRTTADYMTDLFTKEEDGSTVQSDSLTRNSFQRASLRHRLMTTKQTTNKTEHVSALPEDDVHIMDRLSQISKNLDDSTEISEEEKLNLIIVLEKKLGSLHEERQLLNDEIDENNALGKLVTTVVEQKLFVKEFDKYKSYVDELEKMLYLILKLSERLAKAENAVQSLPQNASDREKTTLISKRNELSEKHADALILKEGIDRRRHQVDTYLRNCLTCDELKDYEYFVKMKAQLVIDRQDVEDRIEMRRRYLELLTSTANGGCALKSGDYFGPKSYC